MGQKHNRRRTRPRPRNRLPLQLQLQLQQQHQQQQFPVIAEDDAFYYPSAANYTYHSRSSSSSSLSSTSSSASLMTPLLGPAMLPHALPWHHRYPTWQNQEQEQSYHDKAATLEEERYRLFGGEPGDDIGLCYRMLEYFGGLDFINT